MTRSSAESGKPDGLVVTADEATPLLGAPTTGISNNGIAKVVDADYDERPMDYVQILVLCYASLADPVGYFTIVPFIGEMIERNGHLKEAEIGNWAGIIEGLFSVVQMVLMIFYGRLSDRLGRKPVLVFSLTGMAIGMTLFGFSRNLWQMLLFRAITGLFAGSVVTARTMISENTTKLTQGRAFSWYMFSRNIGILLGPLLGGALSNPARQFPDTFGDVAFFEAYPYALATIVSGALTFSAALLSLFVLRETLVRKGDATNKPEPPMSTWAILKAPGVGIILYIMGHMMFLSLAFTAVSPIFMYTRVDLGGFNLTPSQISYVIAVAGVSQALWILIVFPPVQRAFGSGNTMRVCGVVWPMFMAMYPIINEILRHGLPKLALGLGITALVLGSGVSMAFAAIQLCINDVSPSPAVLGTVNAIGLSISSGVRAIAPPIFTPIYAVGVERGWVDGHFVWFFFVFLALTLNIPFWLLPESVEGKVKAQPASSRSPDHDADDRVIR